VSVPRAVHSPLLVDRPSDCCPMSRGEWVCVQSLLSGRLVAKVLRAANVRKCRLSAEVHSSKRRVDTLRTHCIAMAVWGLEVVCVFCVKI
jgi:hypothetical protein